ncbi:MAG: polysaccharide deacetylase family protein [Bacteroidota bacterium]
MRLFLGLAIGLLGMGCAPSRGLVMYTAERSPNALFSVATADSVIAFTFDDGPEPGNTDAVLDALVEHDARATFFVLCERAVANPDLMQRMVDEGHEIGNHGWQLQMAVLLPAARLRADIARTDSVLRQYASPTWYRPSVGFYNRGVRWAAEASGYRIALGSVYSGDPQTQDVDHHVEHILGAVQPGDIVVLHDGIGDRVTAPEILRSVLLELARRGYRMVTLSDLAAREPDRWRRSASE